MSGRVVLLCGRSFSGKSSLAARLSDVLPGVIVSLDAINAERGLWGGDGIPVEEWAHTNEVGHERVRTIIATGGTVIIDDTSSPRFLRDGWREIASAGGARLVLVYVDTPVPVIMQRLASNRRDPTRGDLSDDVLIEHLSSFEPPTPDEQPLRVEPNFEPADVLGMIKGRWS